MANVKKLIKRIYRAMGKRPRSAADIARRARTTVDTVRDALLILHSQGLTETVKHHRQYMHRHAIVPAENDEKRPP